MDNNRTIEEKNQDKLSDAQTPQVKYLAIGIIIGIIIGGLFGFIYAAKGAMDAGYKAGYKASYNIRCGLPLNTCGANNATPDLTINWSTG
jgi:hypothetical protein